ncbi:MAG: 2-hydroxychromene-2-carboxylate isomerase [Pseudomonadota bacterium]
MTMPATIDYYFTLISPFTYLGHPTLLEVASRHGASLVYKPVNLMNVFQTSGVLPIPERPVSRQNYRLIELQRIADFRQLPLTLKPAYFPTNPGLANGAAIAIAQAGADPSSFVFAALQACWVNEQDIADEGVVRALVEANGHDADAILAAAASTAVTDEMSANTDAAIAAGAVGAPVYVLNGEPFWGQDRIEHLDHALATSREPYTAA